MSRRAPADPSRSPGRPIDSASRIRLDAGFGHSFGKVRVHVDDEAHGMAVGLDARALTIGPDLYFRRGQYAPETPTGFALLAHEAAHVIQESGTPGDIMPTRVSQPSDIDERIADAASSAIASGTDVQVPASSAPGTAVHRWPWDDESASGGDSSGGGGSFWDSAASAVSGAADAVGSGAGALYEGYQRSTDFRGLANELNKGVDWVEQNSAKGNADMAKSAEGIPVLEQLAQATAFVNTQTTNLTGGVVKGVGDLASGMANVFFHPLDAAAGMEGILEHNTTVPFLGSTLKGVHGLYDLAANGGGQYGNSLGDLANHVFNPLQQQEDDANYNSALLRGIVTPGAKDWGESWQRLQDNPMDTLGRAGTNVAPIVMGLGEAAAGEEGVQAANAAPEAALPPESSPPTLRTPYKPPGVPDPAPFNPDIPTIGPEPGPLPEAPAPSVEPQNPNGPTTYNPTGSRGDWAWDPNQFSGEPTPSTPPGFENQPRPYPAPRTPSPLAPEQIPDFGIIDEPGALPSERPMNTVLQEPPSSGPAPDTIPEDPGFPKPPGTPLDPQPIPKLPGGPKGPPIPREELPSGPVDTPRQPMDVPNIPGDEPLPSTKPRGPDTQPAPPSSEGSAVPTERGLGGVPAIPRGFDPFAVIELMQETPGATSVVELMQQLGMPIRRA